jgi:hypothetical protein
MLACDGVVSTSTSSSSSKSGSVNGRTKDVHSGVNEFAPSQHAIDEGEGGYQGYSGDKAFLRRMQEKLKNWPSSEIHRRMILPETPIPSLFDPDHALAMTVSLPPRDKAQILIDAALDSHALFPILHRPTFDYMCNLVYTFRIDEYAAQELRFLPLLYAVLALGCLSAQHGGNMSSREQRISEG